MPTIERLRIDDKMEWCEVNRTPVAGRYTRDPWIVLDPIVYVLDEDDPRIPRVPSRPRRR